MLRGHWSAPGLGTVPPPLSFNALCPLALASPQSPKSVLICVATGTGIAPFRSFWRRCFYENVPGWKFDGLFWLFMGVANSDSLLYEDEIKVGP